MTLLRSFALLVVLAGILPLKSHAQNRYTDSLYTVLKDPQVSSREQIMVLSRLVNIVRYYNEPEALKLADEAVALARKENEAAYKVYAYEARSGVYLKMRDLEKAHNNTDSSMLYAGQTGDVKAKSWAWYRKGRELDFENRSKEAVDAQLKALSFIKGKEYWKEEASIYYALYGIFSTWEDLDNESKYALLSLDAAKKSGDPNNICESWQAVATAASDRYARAKDKDKALLDSVMKANKMAIGVYIQNEGYMTMTQLITIPCINTADAYNRHFPPSPQTTDSVRHYAVMAFNYAVKGRDTRLQAAAFGLLNEDARRNGNYELAETYLLQALSLMIQEPTPDYYVLGNIHRGLSEINEHKKDYVSALKFMKAYVEDYKKIFDTEQAAAGKEMEAKYEAKEKERQIRFLKASEAWHRKQNYLYIGIAAALLIGLLFMFRSYHFRLRYSLQQERILKQEKEEARLLAKLKEEEALLLDAERQKAELHARLREEEAKLKAEEAARLQAEQLVILAQKEMLQKEVLAGNLHVEQKNKVLQDLRDRLEENPGKDIKGYELNKLINRQADLDNDFEEFKLDLKEIHPDFYRRLQSKAGNKLTTLDLKYCAYIFLKRSTKEMAGLMGVEPKSIRMSKYRLKQKLGLGKEEELEDYIRGLV